MSFRTITLEYETDAQGTVRYIENTPIEQVPIALLHSIALRVEEESSQ